MEVRNQGVRKARGSQKGTQLLNLVTSMANSPVVNLLTCRDRLILGTRGLGLAFPYCCCSSNATSWVGVRGRCCLGRKPQAYEYELRHSWPRYSGPGTSSVVWRCRHSRHCKVRDRSEAPWSYSHSFPHLEVSHLRSSSAGVIEQASLLNRAAISLRKASAKLFNRSAGPKVLQSFQPGSLVPGRCVRQCVQGQESLYTMGNGNVG